MKLKETVQAKAGNVQILRLTSRDHPAPPSEFLDSAGNLETNLEILSNKSV